MHCNISLLLIGPLIAEQGLCDALDLRFPLKTSNKKMYICSCRLLSGNERALSKGPVWETMALAIGLCSVLSVQGGLLTLKVALGLVVSG